MKIAFRHIQNNCVLCHANKWKDVDPMGECMPIMGKFVIRAPVALGLSALANHSMSKQGWGKQKSICFISKVTQPAS